MSPNCNRINWNDFSDSHIIKSISTNTKARRIGYLKLFAIFFRSKIQISESIFAKDFEIFCDPYKKQLSNYDNAKGVIDITKNGISAKPYLELAKKLSFFNIINNKYSPGKSFSVFIKCNELWSTGNIFDIDKLDRMFFFREFFLNDFFFLRVILEKIFEDNLSSYNSLKSTFHIDLIRKIEDLNDQLGQRELIKKNQKIKKRIESWTKPQVYLEHILMPRLNWLFDLRLIELQPNLEIKKKSVGKAFLDQIKKWDTNLGYTTANSSEIFRYRFFNTYNDIYSLNKNSIENINSHRDLIINMINECFEHFKTFAPNRVTLSQTLNYLNFYLFWKYNLIIEEVELNKYIKNELKEVYLYRYLPNYNEGYLQKR